MFVSLYHDVATTGGVSSVAQRANFGLSLVFKVQFLVLDADIASPWWTGKEQTEKEEGRRRRERRVSALCLQEHLTNFIVLKYIKIEQND